MMSTTEIAGFVLALVMVVCSIKELHWSWPLAIASSILYFFVFKDSLLYGEAGSPFGVGGNGYARARTHNRPL